MLESGLSPAFPRRWVQQSNQHHALQSANTNVIEINSASRLCLDTRDCTIRLHTLASSAVYAEHNRAKAIPIYGGNPDEID
jgi:hypothetical protein